jgi:TatD-related deoxyribonuclease
MPSVLSSEKNVIAAIEKGTRFMLETDYIDDLKRPGAVLSPKTVPKKTLLLIEKGLLTEDQAYIIHKKNPEKTYGVCLDG